MLIKFRLNGKSVETETEPGLTLFTYLRRNGIYSPKYGCDHGECGACAVLLNDKAVNSCMLLMHQIEGKNIETVESFTWEMQLGEFQQYFLDEGAVQCGYCTPGMLISLEALRREKESFSEAEVRDALAGNLCRCTGYVKPVKAALKFASVEDSR